MKGYRYMKPFGDLIVRDPIQLTPLPKKGAWKPWVGKEGKYWRRRYRDGDIVLCDPPKAEKKKEQIAQKVQKKEIKPKKEVNKNGN